MHTQFQTSEGCAHISPNPCGQGQPVLWELGLESLETIPSLASGQEEKEIIFFGSVPQFCHPFFTESAGKKISALLNNKRNCALKQYHFPELDMPRMLPGSCFKSQIPIHLPALIAWHDLPISLLLFPPPCSP